MAVALLLLLVLQPVRRAKGIVLKQREELFKCSNSHFAIFLLAGGRSCSARHLTGSMNRTQSIFVPETDSKARANDAGRRGEMMHLDYSPATIWSPIHN